MTASPTVTRHPRKAGATPVVRINAAQALPQPGIGNKKSRLSGIDAARGLALLGMMAVHALIPYDENFQPNWVTFVALGNASALFAVLAGVGLALTSGRARVPWTAFGPTAAGIAGRAVAVGVVGLALGYTDPTIAGIILPYYAVFFLLAIPLVFLRSRSLVLVALIAAFVVPFVSHVVRPLLPAPLQDNFSFSYLIQDPKEMLTELTLTGDYPALPWMTYICAGLLIGRLTLSSSKVARRLLIGGIALAIVAKTTSWVLIGPLGGGVALRIAGIGQATADAEIADDLLTFGYDGTTPTTSWWWLATASPHAATPLDLLYTTGVAAGVIGLMLLLGHVTLSKVRKVIGLVTAPLAAAGGMTLTLFTLHIVFMNSPLDGFSPYGGYLVQVVSVLLIGLGWRQAVGRGPLEVAVTAVAGRARAAVQHGALSMVWAKTPGRSVSASRKGKHRATTATRRAAAVVPNGTRRDIVSHERTRGAGFAVSTDHPSGAVWKPVVSRSPVSNVRHSHTARPDRSRQHARR